MRQQIMFKDVSTSPLFAGFAVASFLATEVYMILMSWFSRPDQRVSLAPKIIQQLCASYVAVAMVVAAILSGMAMSVELLFAIVIGSIQLLKVSVLASTKCTWLFASGKHCIASNCIFLVLTW